ncbi:TOMM system kinase/cyclase fusion protein [Pseudoalteromonas xiamenensis]|nr:TOMM system kinase/cyclase fusion protein [Pseudoalteromonas xiamenensis]
MPFTQISDQYIKTAFHSVNYTLLEKIGEGGFGKVYKAKQLNTDQFVAIKFLAIQSYSEEKSKQRYIERFKRETILSSKLHHPNIVRLLDQGQCNENLLFAVFEYVDGQSLKTYLTANGQMSPLVTQDIMLQILDALIHAHQHGIIHRDIKPANIMLSKGGARTHAKILDFGIGTLTQDSRHQEFNTLTLTQETLGTPSYSAPEQLRGEPATERTDLYVWGLLFLECVTGIPAVTGSSLASIYHKQLSDAQVPIPQALLGHPVAGLLRRLLHKNANDRVITGEEAYLELSHMNMANLVGVLNSFKPTNLPSESTVILRNDEPNHPLQTDYTFFTERKQITVLAVRFSISSINNSESDQDVLDALFKSHRGHCLDIATRFGAYHVGSLGDTSLFYFGYPTASDNDLRLCARTALEVMSDLTKRNALMREVNGSILNMHAGIHTGVFTTYANNTPEGQVANTTLALARYAECNEILCSLHARSLLEPFTEFEMHADLKLGMTSSTESVFRMVGERRIEAFGFMRGTRNNHELVGRHTEIKQMFTMLNSPNQSCRVAHIHGEAGIGKSRLLQEIRKSASSFQHLVAQCLPEHQNNALYPILTLVRYLYNISHLSSEKTVELFSDILSEHNSSLELQQALPILLIWLNIEFGEELTASTLAPEQQKSILFNSLTTLLSGKHFSLSEHKLYIVEDIHWADTTTLEFIAHFANRLNNNGDVLVNTSRQPVPNLLHDLNPIDIGLQKLTERASEDFIVNLFDDQPVSRNVLDVLINRTDGIPLFIEELVDMVKQKKLVCMTNGEINFVSPDKLEQVPSSLRESLQQKLDGLVYAKETAQLAATIGREFEYALLVAVSSLSENQIQNDLNELVAKDLIVHQRHVSNDSYIFKHALVRDAAYDSVSEVEKIKNHSNIANRIIGLKNENDCISELYYHLNRSKQYLRSAHYGYKIAKTYSALGFYTSAHNLLDNCINLVSEKEIFENPVTFIKINCLKISCLVAIEGSGSREILSISSYNQELIKISKHSDISCDLTHYLHHINWSTMTYHHMTSNRVKALELALDESTNASTLNYTDDQKIVSFIQVANCYLLDGNITESFNFVQKALNIFCFKDAEFEDNSCIEYGFSSKTFLYMIKASLEACSKNSNAKDSIHTAIAISKNAKSPVSELMSLGYGAICGYLLSDNPFICDCIDKMSILLSKHSDLGHFSMYLYMPKAYIQEDIENLEQSIRVMEQSGQTQWISLYKCMLIDILKNNGLHEKANGVVLTTLKWCESSNEKVMYKKLKEYLKEGSHEK